MPEANVLVVYGEKQHRDILRDLLLGRGYNVYSASNGKAGLQHLNQFPIDVVFLGIELPDIGGERLLETIKEKDPTVAVVMVCESANADVIVRCIKKGAENFISRTVDAEELELKLQMAMRKREVLSGEAETITRALKANAFGGLIGRSSAIRRVFEIARIIAPSRASVLIVGQSDTGKRLLARAIHDVSGRSKYLAIDCAGLTQYQFENELFGCEKNLPSKGYTKKDGFLIAANGGTILMQEISEIPKRLQEKFLRVVETGKFMPVAGTNQYKVDVRFLATTSLDLDTLLSRGSLQKDFFFRMNVATLSLPALSERREDVPLLAYHFLAKHSEGVAKKISGFTSEAMNRLITSQWPGNVTELENAVKKAVTFCKGPYIRAADLKIKLSPLSFPSERALSEGRSLSEILCDYEKKVLIETLNRCGNNKTECARMLKLTLVTLWRKLKRYGLA